MQKRYLRHKNLRFKTLIQKILHIVVKKRRPFGASPKKKFNPLAKSDKKPLSLIDFASALEVIVPNSIYSSYFCPEA